MLKAFTIVFALFLSACAGMDYAMKNYTGVEVVKYSYAGDVYRVFDKPEESRLMITPSIGASVGAGAVQGLTLGLSGPMSVEGQFRAVTLAYLKSTGRQCQIANGALVAQPQWEFFYLCKK